MNSIEIYLAFVVLAIAVVVSGFIFAIRLRQKKVGVEQPIQTLPPNDLSIGEIGILLDNKLDYLDIAGEICDLILKKALIYEKGGLKVGDLKDYEKLGVEQKRFIEVLFEKNDVKEIKIRDLNDKLKGKLFKLRNKLYGELVRKKYYDVSPLVQRGPYLSLGYIFGLLAVIVLAIGPREWELGLYLTGAFLLGGLMIIFAAEGMGRRSERGNELFNRIMGYKNFIKTAEKNRIEYLAKNEPDFYYRSLPFALIFGVLKKWQVEEMDLTGKEFKEQFESFKGAAGGLRESLQKNTGLIWLLTYSISMFVSGVREVLIWLRAKFPGLKDHIPDEMLKK
ncbi:DUF2207 domain-containing protein [Candidatus Peregrinibacteria bacterium]|nr:DUF2207 domain-containing protein [Candidatus Peregrinibacteria bacterium]